MGNTLKLLATQDTMLANWPWLILLPHEIYESFQMGIGWIGMKAYPYQTVGNDHISPILFAGTFEVDDFPNFFGDM